MVYLYAFMAFGLIALILAAIYRPLGDYMYRVYTTDKDLFFEKWIYRIIGVDSSKGQSWKAYFRGVLGFSVMSLLVLYLLQRVAVLAAVLAGLRQRAGSAGVQHGRILRDEHELAVLFA